MGPAKTLIARATLLALLATSHANAQVPEALNYQGFLTNAAGQPLDDAVDVLFSLYTSPTGGTPLWTDVQTVVPSSGLFTVELGRAVNPFPAGVVSSRHRSRPECRDKAACRTRPPERD